MMAHVVAREFTGTAPIGTGTVALILGVDSAADYDEATWIHDPDLNAVDSLPIEHWKLVGEGVEALRREPFR